MSHRQRRAVLYGAGMVAAVGMLFRGFRDHVPPDPGVRLNGASLLAGAGQYDQALEICDIVLREHPDNLEARVFRAVFLSMAERYDAAIAAYDDALAHAGDDDEMRRNLIMDRASILLSAGRHEEFRRERARLARDGLGPPVPGAGLAWRRSEQAKDWDAAVQAYRGAHERQPLDQPIKARLWGALVEQGQAALAARTSLRRGAAGLRRGATALPDRPEGAPEGDRGEVGPGRSRGRPAPLPRAGTRHAGYCPAASSGPPRRCWTRAAGRRPWTRSQRLWRSILPARARSSTRKEPGKRAGTIPMSAGFSKRDKSGPDTGCPLKSE